MSETPYNIYQSPLSSRYASKDMLQLFSAQRKFEIWRELWIALAESEHELGLAVSAAQIEEMKCFRKQINFDRAAEYEFKLRHDVMAHVHAYGEQCPKAAGIIHLGATSCYVTDNTDLILIREGLTLLRRKLIRLLGQLAKFADRYKELPCLGFTHYQPAQPVTLGKRACLWLHDLLLDLEDLDHQTAQLKFHGCRGTTGTQASFMELFDGDEAKVVRLDQMIAQKMKFSAVYPVSGQTYTRKIDFRVLSVLSGIAQSAHKFANDLRLLQNLKELEEPFEKTQVGSSAMAYKRNPMRSERMTSLARYVIGNLHNPAQTAAEQWLERTLDDSANKRIAVPEAFLAVDAILNLYLNISADLVVYEKMIERHLRDELPFMATENILMQATKRGGDRQQLHEKIRQYAMAAGQRVKADGLANDLLSRIAADPAFGLKADELEQLLDPALYTGRAASQVDDFLEQDVWPLLRSESTDQDEWTAEIKV